MKKIRNSTLIFVLLIFFLVISEKSYGQIDQQRVDNLFKNTKELYFEFNYSSKGELNDISKIISIDHLTNDEKAFAYANKKEFSAFLKKDVDYTILRHPSQGVHPKMSATIDLKSVNEWDFYPTYEAYISLMNQFATDYPEICQVFSIGQTVEGRELMVARISSNVGEVSDKPQFLYTSTMHGNETAGYVLSLHLIDYLLSNYGNDDRITDMVNNIDIFINPLANPDGTYAIGNHTVEGSTRFNGNGIDLNRNYPDPDDGLHPDGNDYQPETQAFMQFATDNHFTMSCNWHSGTSVANYPWDTYEELHPDDDWWRLVMREWADTAQVNSPDGYFTNLDNGITNGYAWYEVTGGRQDYMNYFQHCRESTIELSGDFVLPAEQLPDYWAYNYRSMLNYLEQVIYGIKGTVTDTDSGELLEAKVFIEDHDARNTWVLSSAETGNYFRPMMAGEYAVTFSADCYEPVTLTGVTVANYQTVTRNVALQQIEMATDFTVSDELISIGDTIDFYDDSCGNPLGWEWTFEGGTPAVSTDQNPIGIVYEEAGVYDVQLRVLFETDTITVVKENYIEVIEIYQITNGIVSTCSGQFLDTGGEDGAYGNNEHYVMNLYPQYPPQKVIVEFVEFDLEYDQECQYDWLKIYDGGDTTATLIGKYCGDNSPGIVQSTSASGALTFEFSSDGSETRAGWKAILSCSEVAPFAYLGADTTTVFEGDTVHFMDLSPNYPTEWLWTFEGGMPETSIEQNPVVVYQTEGVYDVKLKATNEIGSDSITFSSFIHVEKVVGISNFQAAKLRIFPNPAKNFITFQSDVEMISIELLDLNGKRVQKQFVHANNGQVNISTLPSGVYIVRVMTEKGTLVGKVLR